MFITIEIIDMNMQTYITFKETQGTNSFNNKIYNVQVHLPQF